jgi:predicted AlkP superfamily phosphohydrolase/phosphomutase
MSGTLMLNSLIAGVAAVGALLTGCGRAPAAASAKKMIVLGVDGMDPDFLEAHWASLPNLNRLRHAGGFRRLGTSIPPQSPVAWSNFITGMDPGGHGIFDFVHRDPATLAPFSSMAQAEEAKHRLTIGNFSFPLSSGTVRLLRKGVPFWEDLGAHGVQATVIRMPTNFPPVGRKSLTLSGMGTPDLQGGSFFSYYTDDPGEIRESVPGGRIFRIDCANHWAEISIPGPANTFRTGRPASSATVRMDVDAAQGLARFDFGDRQLILKPGEWSDWVRLRFPLLPGIKDEIGIVRLFLRRVQPHVELYVSPVNIDPTAPEFPISTPTSYSSELAGALGLFYTQGIAEDTSALRAGALNHQQFLEQSQSVLSDSLRMFRYQLDRFRQGLLFFYFSSIDQNSHMLWGKFEGELLNFYRQLDGAVGEALDKSAPDTTIIVMSDHGFAPFDRAVHLNTWLMKEGFLALDDAANVGDEEMFPHVDWSKTQAYSLGLNGLYLNLKGREVNGIVEPGEAAAGVLKRLSERLLAFRDPQSGEPVVKRVYQSHIVFQDKHLENAPDLIVGYARRYRSSWQTSLGAVPKDVIEDNTQAWIGDHCMAAEVVPGVFLSNRTIRRDAPELIDVTATIFNQFGVAPSERIKGQPII